MNIDKFLQTDRGNVYLRTVNGLWKKFDNILQEALEENVIKLKKRRFKVEGEWAWGGRCMGENSDEIWLYAKLSPKEIEETFIYEITGFHYEDAGLIEGDDDTNKFLENVAQKIWQNKNCRSMIKSVLKGYEEDEPRETFLLS